MHEVGICVEPDGGTRTDKNMDPELPVELVRHEDYWN